MENAVPQLRSTRSYHHRSESSIQLSNSDKFFCKLLEKESDECISPNSNPSFRVLWETAPGTPKHQLSLDKDGAANVVVPPLTPPPRYIKYGSGNGSVKRGPRKVLKGFRLRIRSTKKSMLHFKYLFKSQWTSALGRKALLPLRSWRSVVRFWSRSGRGQEGILKKLTSFGGCFSS